METQVSLLLTKFALAFGDFKNGFIEIITNNKRENVPYPQINPISLIFPPKFLFPYILYHNREKKSKIKGERLSSPFCLRF